MIAIRSQRVASRLKVLRSLTVIFGLSLVALTLLTTVVVPQKASAAGGVGGGGSGGSTGGSGWGWTTYGHGWAVFPVTSGGPSAGFHTGTWATVKAACTGTSSGVAIYIMGTGTNPLTGPNNASGKYMGYDYKNYGGEWAGGLTRNSVPTISEATAKNAFDNLGTYGISTAGFTWGSTVGWFCYGIYPTDVYPFVAPASASIVRGNPATFTLQRTVINYTGPAKTAKYSISYGYSATGTFSNIPTTVTTVYDNTVTTPLSLTINKDTSKLSITPNLTFPANTISAAAKQICVRMQFVGTEPVHVNYKNNPHTACTAITEPPALPWTITGTSKPVKNGTVGTAGVLMHAVAGDVIKFQHTLANSSTSATVSPGINYAGVNSNATAAGLTLAAGAVAGLNIGQTSAALVSGSYTIQLADVGNTYCQALSFNPTSDGNAGASQSASACIVIDPPSVACTQTLSTSPSRLQPGDVAAYIRLAFPSAAVAQSLTYSIPGVVAANTVAIAAGQGTYDIPNVTMPNAAQDFAATWSVTGATGNCTGTVSVVDMPYFSVYGASVRAGGDFGGASAGGVLAAWRNYSGGANYGAGTQLSAIALLAITGFASKDIAPYANPVQQSFANNAATSNSPDSPALGGTYGGNYSLIEPIVPSSGVTDIGGTGTFSFTSQDGAFKKSGNVTINTSTVGVGKNVSIFVTGNVYISGNINYATGWTKQSDVPSAVIVATGNIYIDPSVTNLDGTFVAKTGLYTCADSGGATASTGLYGCNKQLVVHGSFVAKKMYLLRTLGTLKDDATHSNVGCHNSGGIGSSRGTCAAEVFDFSPEMYLANPQIQPPSNGALNYDAIVNLPPIL